MIFCAICAGTSSYLSNAIVKPVSYTHLLHKANYGVDSTVGKGTTFWFELNWVKTEKTKELPAHKSQEKE